MTSSDLPPDLPQAPPAPAEPPAPAAMDPAPAAPAAPEPPVLARGHLHPGVLLLRLLDALRQAIFPALLGVVVEPVFLAIAGAMFLLQLGTALARYLTITYTLSAEELVVREGILSRQERRIPLDRIQDLGFESTLLRRALGLVVVLVETASGKGAEARLDSLGRDEAVHLRETLLAARATRGLAAAGPLAGPAGAVAPAAPWQPEPELLVHRSASSSLLLRGLTDLRVGAIGLTFLAFLEIAQQFGSVSDLEGIARSILSWLADFSVPVAALLLAGAVALALGLGMAASALGNLVMFHGFALTLRGAVLQRRYGLLTTRAKSLPLRRVQRVLLEQNWLRRLLGLCVGRADSAGAGMDDASEGAGGWDVVVPMASLREAEAVLPVLLPELREAAPPWQPVSSRIVWRVFLKGALLALVLLVGSAVLDPAALVPGLAGAESPAAGGIPALWLLPLLPAAWVVGWLSWRNLAWAFGSGMLVLRWGIVGQYRAFVPTRRIQSVLLTAGPLQRLLGLATITVHVAGGSPTSLADLPRGDAEHLRARLASEAAVAARHEWPARRAAVLAAAPAPA